MYLLKPMSSDTCFQIIKRYIDEIHSDRCDNGTGIMVSLAAIDSQWLLDS